jgi:putative N-acetyltransferase (TIGR04045 family)
MLEKEKVELPSQTALQSSTPSLEIRIASEPWEIEAYYRIRHQVFVEEQGVFKDSDRDEHDETGIPIIACCDGRIAGVVRCYPTSEGIWYGGRLAVHRDYRKYDIGTRLVRKAVETMERHEDVERFVANIQIQNVRFFRRLGWFRVGQPFLFNGIRHQMMEAPLDRGRQ